MDVEEFLINLILFILIFSFYYGIAYLLQFLMFFSRKNFITDSNEPKNYRFLQWRWNR